jgi:lysophospholipase
LGSNGGAVVICPGFREVIEKYFEVTKEMAGLGFSVWIMDWHGQGGSDRFLDDNPQKMYNEGYEEHIDTLRQFASEVVQTASGRVFLLAHSMGAHIGLRCMKEHPGIFDKAVMTSPMFDIKTPGFVRPVARVIIYWANRLHWLKKYAPGGRDWSARDEMFAGNIKTSDPTRFRAVAEIMSEKPELKMGLPTYGWVFHTFESCNILNKESYLKEIKTPVLMGIAGDDQIVESGAEVRACKLMPACTAVEIPQARHEIWMERDDLRAPWLAQVGAFLRDKR